jgi:hypothetical protein
MFIEAPAGSLDAAARPVAATTSRKRDGGSLEQGLRPRLARADSV